MTNKEWTDLFTKEFQVSRTIAKKMLHQCMVIKNTETLYKSILSKEKDSKC